MEQWKEIDNYNGYWISSEGRVWSVRANRTLSPYTTAKGYHTVQLYNQEGRRGHRVHVLVAENFLEGTGEQVNHKIKVCDGGTDAVSNLEWVTSRENNQHRQGVSLQRVRQLTLDGTLVKEYQSMAEAGDALDKDPKNIRRAATGHRHTAYGFKWELY